MHVHVHQINDGKATYSEYKKQYDIPLTRLFQKNMTVQPEDIQSSRVSRDGYIHYLTPHVEMNNTRATRDAHTSTLH